MTAYDHDTIERNGRTFTVEYHHDDAMGAPWGEHDGHGAVSEWTTRAKRAGELVLASDRSSRRYYDFAEACETARRDGWRANPEHSTDTPRRVAADAARADFEYLRRWCNDEWHWCGLAVTMLDADGNPVRGAEASLWGMESDARDYLAETALELADEALATFQALPADA